MTAHVKTLSESFGFFSASLDGTQSHLAGVQHLAPATFFHATQAQRDIAPQFNSLTLYNTTSGSLEYYAHNTWVPFVHASTTPAYGDTLAYNTTTGLWEPSPTTNPTVDSLRIYGSSTTALEVKRVYSDTGGSHSSSTGSMDAVGVHTLTGSSNVTYTITIDSSGTQDWFNATFTWTDSTTTETLVPVYSGSTDGRKVLAPIELSNGVFVLFTVGNYVNGETWTVTAIAASNQITALRVATSPATGEASAVMLLNQATQYAEMGIQQTASYGAWLLRDGASSPRRFGLIIEDFNTFDGGTALAYTVGGGRDEWYLGITYYDQDLAPGLVLDHNSGGSFSVRVAPIQLDELASASTPDANRAKFYAKDKSSETIPYWRNSTAEYEIGLLGTTAAPIGADYLVGTTQSGLTNEIVVGTSPGGELGGTWASPTVDTTHSGSSHAGVVSTHEAAADPHTGYVLESLLDAKGDLISASAADTPVILTVGANDTILMADSSTASGLKWVASATPVAIGTTLATGTSDDFARASHVHVATTLVDGSGGTTRVLAASSSPHVAITGDADISAHLAVGAAATVGTAQVLLIQENPTQAADWKGLYVTGTVTTASSAAARTYIGLDNIMGLSGANAVGGFIGTRTYYEHNVAATVTTFTGHQSLLYVGSLFGSTTAAVATTFIGSDISVTVNPDTTTTSQTPVGTLKGQLITVNHNATANAGQTATISNVYGLHVDVNMGTSAQQRVSTLWGLDVDMSGVTLGTINTTFMLRLVPPAGATTTTLFGIHEQGATTNNWLEGRTEFGALVASTQPTIASTSPRLTVTETTKGTDGSTVGNPVLRLRTVSAGDDPTLDIYHQRVTTTDATVTSVAVTGSLAASTTYFLEAYVTARRTGGVAGTAHDGAAYIVTAAVQGADGVTAVLIATTTTVVGENQAAWTAVIDVTGATARVRVTGAANNNVTWHCELRVRSVGS